MCSPQSSMWTLQTERRIRRAGLMRERHRNEKQTLRHLARSCNFGAPSTLAARNLQHRTRAKQADLGHLGLNLESRLDLRPCNELAACLVMALAFGCPRRAVHVQLDPAHASEMEKLHKIRHEIIYCFVGPQRKSCEACHRAATRCKCQW